VNVVEINPSSLATLAHYVETTISFTLIIVYVIITHQTHTSFHEENAKFNQRAAWPYLSPQTWILEKRTGANGGRVKTTNAKVLKYELTTLNAHIVWRYSRQNDFDGDLGKLV